MGEWDSVRTGLEVDGEAANAEIGGAVVEDGAVGVLAAAGVAGVHSAAVRADQRAALRLHAPQRRFQAVVRGSGGTKTARHGSEADGGAGNDGTGGL